MITQDLVKRLFDYDEEARNMHYGEFCRHV